MQATFSRSLPSIATRPSLRIGYVLSMSFLVSGAVVAQGAEPRRTARPGPEAVFDRPVGEILPALAGAKLAGSSRRVGDELVFWPYELADGRGVSLFACAPVRNVDCAQRAQSICATTTEVLETRETIGTVVRRVCSGLVTTFGGEARAGCRDTEVDVELLVGLVECR